MARTTGLGTSPRSDPLKLFIPRNAKVDKNATNAKPRYMAGTRAVLDTERITALRAQGISWKRIAAELGVGVGTIHQASRNAAMLLGGSKTQGKVF
jgi:DNA-binding NarL/FixJ family response regulator